MSRHVLLLATGNAKKARELAALVGDTYVVATLKDFGIDVDVDENQPDFIGNAKLKCEAVHVVLDSHPRAPEVHAVLADDSGICVDALGGAPGVRSARFASDHDAGEGDAANNALLLKRLSGLDAEQRGASFRCAVVMDVLPERTRYVAEGQVVGRIAHDARGAGGFGYDPLFIPNAYPTRRMAELSSDEKHAISHRGEAMRAMTAHLLPS